MEESQLHYVYLLREREFIRTNEAVYKIGKTKQPRLGRFKNYPIGSELISHEMCDNCDEIEKQLIAAFKINFKCCPQYGAEYFEGDPREMRHAIFQAIGTYDAKHPYICRYCNERYLSAQSNYDHRRICSSNPANIVVPAAPIPAPAPTEPPQIAAARTTNTIGFGNNQRQDIDEFVRMINSQWAPHSLQDARDQIVKHITRYINCLIDDIVDEHSNQDAGTPPRTLEAAHHNLLLRYLECNIATYDISTDYTMTIYGELSTEGIPKRHRKRCRAQIGADMTAHVHKRSATFHADARAAAAVGINPAAFTA